MQACRLRIAALLWVYISKGVSEIMRKGLINDLRSILPVMYGYEEDGLACCWQLEKQTRQRDTGLCAILNG